MDLSNDELLEIRKALKEEEFRTLAWFDIHGDPEGSEMDSANVRSLTGVLSKVETEISVRGLS